MESSNQPPLKKKRLSHACNRCRSRKVRCDELQPACTNCAKAGLSCITIDPRNGSFARRSEAPSGSTFTAKSIIRVPRTTPHLTASGEEDGMSPAISTILLPVLPRFVHANSLSVLTQWLNLAFARLGVEQRISGPNSNAGTPGATSNRCEDAIREEELLALLANSGDLVGRYMQYMHRVVPILDDVPAIIALARGHDDQEDQWKMLAMLMSALIIALATCSDVSPQSRRLGARCFNYAYVRLPLIIEEGQSLKAICALILMALYLRWSNDAKKSWHIHSLAAAMAQSQGLNRKAPTVKAKTAGINAEIRVFWLLYIFDKVMSVETERRPLLPGVDSDQPLPSATPGDETFRALIALAKIQDNLLARLELSRVAEENATTAIALNKVIKDKMRIVGELDETIQNFVESLPQDLKPSEYLYCEPCNLAASSLLAVQYYQTVFLLHRNALTLSMDSIRSQVNELFPGMPYRNRLRNGPNVCVQSARSILNILSHSRETGVYSAFTTSYAPLLAMYALTIYAMRKLSPATVKSDIALQATAIALIQESQASELNAQKTSDLLSPLQSLHLFTMNYVRQQEPGAQSDSSLAPANIGRARDVSEGLEQNVISPPQSPATNMASSQNSAPIIAAAPTSDGLTQVPSWPPLDGTYDDIFPGGDLSQVDFDWDALALAFDLPQAWTDIG